jgi:YVTN family beta-propeller protein
VAVNPDGSKVYVTNEVSSNVSVISSATNTVISTIPVGTGPIGLAVMPDGSKVYVANRGAGSVSVINTATNTVTATVAVGANPTAFGVFIRPPAATQSVPTLSEWAMLLLALSLGGLAVQALRRTSTI